MPGPKLGFEMWGIRLNAEGVFAIVAAIVLVALILAFYRSEMSEPNELQKSLIEEATYLRGKILTSYAQVGFLLADFSVKLDLRFPYRISDRIRAAKRICERPAFSASRHFRRPCSAASARSPGR